MGSYNIDARASGTYLAISSFLFLTEIVFYHEDLHAPPHRSMFRQL